MQTITYPADLELDARLLNNDRVDLRLKFLMGLNDISHSELAKAMGYSQSASVHSWTCDREKKWAKTPNRKSMERAAEIFDVAPLWLRKGTGPMSRSATFKFAESVDEHAIAQLNVPDQMIPGGLKTPRAIDARIRYVRNLRSWAQKELASRASISSACLSNIEGGTSFPRHGTLKSLASAMGVNYKWLKEGSGPMHPGSSYSGDNGTCRAGESNGHGTGAMTAHDELYDRFRHALESLRQDGDRAATRRQLGIAMRMLNDVQGEVNRLAARIASCDS